jgi:hypothetical protein
MQENGRKVKEVERAYPYVLIQGCSNIYIDVSELGERSDQDSGTNVSQRALPHRRFGLTRRSKSLRVPIMLPRK